MAKFSEGDFIVIISNDCYDDISEGDVGVIDAINNSWDRPFRVRIEGKTNRHGSTGMYYFDWYDFEKQKVNKKEKTKTMKNKQLLKGYKKALVRFRDPIKNGYTDVWYALYDDDVKNGDFVLCATARHGHVIAEVFDIPDEKITRTIEVECGREIICKIDYTNYNERQAKLERIEDIKKVMNKKKEELNELAVYELLAKSSPEMANMLKELKELL